MRPDSLMRFLALAATCMAAVFAHAAPPEGEAPAVAPAVAPASTSTPPTTAAATDAKPIRVSVIGASASAGFGCILREERADGPYAADFRLIDMVRLACPELELVTSDLSSGFFFNAPVRNGTRAVDRSLEFRPDCVIALDFLFWYCYGDDNHEGKRLQDESQRLEKLERGLAELARFDVPVLVGDIPDMAPAVGRMLSRAQMPKPETLEALNRRLAEWVAGRANIRLVPLARMQRQLMEEGILELYGRRLEATKESPLLQRDKLHPAPLGMAGLACAVAIELKDALRAAGESATIADAEDCEPEPEGALGRARESMRRIGPPPAPPAAPSPQ